MPRKLRVGGLAAVGSAALLVPLLTIAPADAVIPKADLSITKLVAPTAPNEQVVAVPGDFTSLSDTRATGSYALEATGLHLMTTGSTSTDKVAEYVSSNVPLSAVSAPNTEPDLEYTNNGPNGAPNYAPGFQLVMDFDNDGDYDGILVGETNFSPNWWLGAHRDFVKDPAVVANPDTPRVEVLAAGHYRHLNGPLAAWSAEYPNARVLAFGFSLGSGAKGDGVLNAMNFAGTRYTFGNYAASIQAAPGETVQYQLTVANAAGAKAAENVKVTDVLPPELTYVAGSLVDNGNGCAFAGNVLTCNAGTFPGGISSTITFQATLDDEISSAGLPMAEGHWVDVQKQETFADIPAGFDGSFEATCPAGFLATDGGLLVDAVDQGGFYSDVVIRASERLTNGAGPESWRVKVTNLGDERAQGKAKVTCLRSTVGESSGHSHTIVAATTGGTQLISAGDPETSGRTVTRSCPVGATPVAPVHTVESGLGVIRESYADGNAWVWMVDHSAGTEAWFGITCLDQETSENAGHTATLELATVDDTITVGPESRAEGVMPCPGTGHAVVGGYAGYTSNVLSLGKEARGTNYMFRFHNDDWENAQDADIQVTCVGVRTSPEAAYYHVTNTALVTTSTKDRNSSDNASSADVAVDGDPLAPAPSGVMVDTAGDRTVNSGKTKFVNLDVKCTTACSFTVKVISGGDVVAKATKSLVADPDFQPVSVATTSKGKNLGAGLVNVKVKTSSGTSTFPVTLS